jgi:hypothetical protein
MCCLNDLPEKQKLLLDGLPDDYSLLIKSLLKIHKHIKIGKSLHKDIIVYMPSPLALELDGLKELNSKHLRLNLTYHLNKNNGGNTNAYCMKYDVCYTVSELLSMKPVDERGHTVVTPRLTGFVDTDVLIKWHDGRMVPKPPGETIPITDLPEAHPAVTYVRSRGFTPESLRGQFNASYCISEYQDRDVYYKLLPKGLKISPQGRIVFWLETYGKYCGWQARLIEREDRGVLYYWQPYDGVWVPVKRWSGEGGDGWVPLTGDMDFKNPKYLIGKGTRKTELLMGFDAAVASGKDYAVVVEGVFDAAALGPPAVSVQGKFLTEDQAALLANHFSFVYVIGDTGRYRTVLVDSVTENLAATGIPVKELRFPEQYEDVGAIPKDKIAAIFPELNK